MPKPQSFDSARLLFIRRWGEMAASWGISRTMAEIHALLYLSTEPLCTDDVMEQIEVSRGSASTNLRQLVNWGLIHRVHRRNDRKEYFEAERDVWQMFETIIRERRRREVQPIMETLDRCLAMVDEEQRRSPQGTKAEVEAFRRRFTDIGEFFELTNTLLNLMNKAGRTGLRPLATKLARLMG
ncbi:MAG: MarR family transcriptional regulator [Planctomycetota bacterium]